MRWCSGFKWSVNEGAAPLGSCHGCQLSTGGCCGREGHRGGGVEVVVIVLAGYLPFFIIISNFHHFFIPCHLFLSIPLHFSLFTSLSLTILQQETGIHFPPSFPSRPHFLPLSPLLYSLIPGSLLVTCRCKSFNPLLCPLALPPATFT